VKAAGSLAGLDFNKRALQRHDIYLPQHYKHSRLQVKMKPDEEAFYYTGAFPLF
jgi:hypothetical protein